MDFQRREIQFSGRVQGVGFRYTTQRISTDHDVAGFVQNLPNGRVLLVVEGTRRAIDGFVTAIQSSMQDKIREVLQTPQEYTGEFSDFSIHR